MIKRNNKRMNNSESGWVIVVSIVVMSLLLGLGLATLALVDTQQSQGANQRVREDAFNLAEGVLYSQSQILARNWPSDSTVAFPSSCSQGSTSVTLCTDPTTISSSTGATNPIFTATSNGDFTGAGNVRWNSYVRDNGDSAGHIVTSYDKNTANGLASNGVTPAPQAKCSVPITVAQTCSSQSGTLSTCTTPCTYDFNGDNQVFVRSEGFVRGHWRRIVALMKLEVKTLKFNGGVLTSGWVTSSNSGNKVVIDAKGSSATASVVTLTCTANTTNCPDPNLTSAGKGQISPTNDYVTGASVLPGLSDTDFSDLLASADRVYDDATGCPGNTVAAWTGIVVLNFTTAHACDMGTPSNTVINSAANPGVVVIQSGSLAFPNNTTYYGYIYARNKSNSTGTCVDLSGNGQVIGGVTADNGCGVIVGGAGNSIVYDPNAIKGFKSQGTTGLVQSTWRELTPTQ
jgi:hypothetical protein